MTLLEVADVQWVPTGGVFGLIASNLAYHSPLPAAPGVGCSLLTLICRPPPRVGGTSTLLPLNARAPHVECRVQNDAGADIDLMRKTAPPGPTRVEMVREHSIL